MILVLGIVIGTISSVLASTLLASNVAYTPKDSKWKVNNVEAAIDSLKLSKTSDNYSTEEKVVGTWIDGKPLYQKTYVINISARNQWLNIDSTFTSEIYTIVGQEWSYKDYYNGNSDYGDMTLEVDTSGLRTIFLSSYSGSYKTNLTIKYTKSTD